MKFINKEVVEDLLGNIYIVIKRKNKEDLFFNGVNELKLIEIKTGVKKIWY